MLTRQEMRVFRLDKKCSKCNEGFLIATGKSFTAGSTSIEHKCNKCDNIEILINDRYPKFMHEPTGEAVEIDENEYNEKFRTIVPIMTPMMVKNQSAPNIPNIRISNIPNDGTTMKINLNPEK